MKTIAIIGGGPAAIATAYELLKELKKNDLPEPIEIIIFEKGKHIGPGLPYSSEEECYILNLPITAMRADFSNESKFSTWFTSTYPHIRTKFPPRKYFGYFLIHLFSLVQQQALTANITLRAFTQTEVTKITKQSKDKYLINTTKGHQEADHIILCTGHMQSTLYQELKVHPGYRHNPWENQAFEGIDPAQTVGVIGSRLSAIDVAMKLREQKHTGKIIFFSRSGLLPTVLAKHVPPYTLKHLTMNNFNLLTKDGMQNLPLDELLALFWQEINEAEGRQENPITYQSFCQTLSGMTALERLNSEIKLAENPTSPRWQQVMFAMYPIVPQIWKLLSFADKKQFMQKYYSLYITFLAAFPLDNAYKIRTMLEKKQLQVVGGLIGIKHTGEEFILTTEQQTKQQTEQQTEQQTKQQTQQQTQYQCGAILNATGLSYTPGAPYDDLFGQKIAKPHKLGGICVDPQTLRVLDYNDTEQSTLHAVGELTRGACLATTDMGQLTRQISRVVTDVIRSMTNNTPSTLPNKRGGETQESREQQQCLNACSLFQLMPKRRTLLACLVGAAVGGYWATTHFRPRLK